MKADVVFRKAAERDVERIEDWYERRRPGLGDAFREALGEAVDQIASRPLMYPALYQENRRVLLHRFPYKLWYRLEGKGVIVLACIHGKRRPQYERTRLRRRLS